MQLHPRRESALKSVFNSFLYDKSKVKDPSPLIAEMEQLVASPFPFEDSKNRPKSHGTQDLIEVSHWSDRDVQIPAGLGLPNVPAEVAGLYLKMRTVGTEARSSMDRLQARTGWGRDKIRRWQFEAQTLGWIFLLAEGRSLWDPKGFFRGVPRQWWLCSSPFALPEIEYLKKFQPKLEFPAHPDTWSRALKNHHLPQDVGGRGLNSSNLIFSLLKTSHQTRSLKDQQDLKQPKKREGHPGADAPPPPSAPPQPSQGQAILTRLNGARRLSRYAADYANTPQNRGAAILCEKAYGEKLEAAHEAFLADDSAGLIKRHHPLSILAAQPDSYMPGVVVKPKPKPECAGPGPHGGARNYAGTSWCAHCTERRNQERHP